MSNYDKARECAQDAYHWTTVENAEIAALRAQTYATLALVDAVNDMRSFVAEYLAAAEDVMSTGIKEVVADEVSSALLDALRPVDSNVKGGVA